MKRIAIAMAGLIALACTVLPATASPTEPAFEPTMPELFTAYAATDQVTTAALPAVKAPPCADARGKAGATLVILKTLHTGPAALQEVAPRYVSTGKPNACLAPAKKLRLDRWAT